ncbi:MAG: heterodisulfide reductase-related iron-sulfur binding cluster [Ilumatobacter sp.]|uniref:heterodisulfide reductase-related iron-sulfur binding cluster n=1 Tax=Ilumatobacter sp. TaxID=1967498 RepID=UPI003C775D48
MTTTSDPLHALYTDEAEVRSELARVQDICHGCRQCIDLCGSFPTLFDMLDRMSKPSAGLLTPAEQDQVVSECVHCTLCAVDCPYGPQQNDRSRNGSAGNGAAAQQADVDVPRLMLRARAMQFEHGHLAGTGKKAARVLARPDRVGRIATRVPSIANAVIGSKTGSRRRRLLARLTGVSADRHLGTFAAQRFSAWFRERPTIKLHRRQAAVMVFPTCLVEYQATSIGKDLVKVYERNGVECGVSSARCCGAPLLHAGDIAAFRKVAEKNLSQLATEIRDGKDIVVPQPACAHVLTVDSVEHVSSVDARVDAALVAEHTYDASGYLVGLHRGDDYVLDTDFEGETHRRITYQASSHMRARGVGYPSRDLMRLTGARIEVIQEPSGVGGIWSLRTRTDADDSTTQRLAERVAAGTGGVVASDSHLASLAIAERTGMMPIHPLQVVARAYGIPDEI